MNAWNEIIGHEWAVEVLADAIEHQRVGHAYLITGIEQVGKATLARTFAMALNCREAKRPCGKCRSCQLIKASRHPDVAVVTPETNKRGKLSLKIETIRELQRSLQLAAYEGLYKIAIIERFDAATLGAANAFLKTLEEPPRNVILILTAIDADSMLDTIKSRCRVVAVRPIPTNTIYQSLVTKWHVPHDQAHLLAHLADGKLGWAVDAATNANLLEQRQARIDQLQTILAGNRVLRFKSAEKLSRTPDQLAPLLNQWITWWRDLFLLSQKTGSDDVLVNIDLRDQLEQLAHKWKEAAIIGSLRKSAEAIRHLEQNANTRLVLENLFLTYPVIREP